MYDLCTQHRAQCVLLQIFFFFYVFMKYTLGRAEKTKSKKVV
uniref:Uncharacterized protein n=1 Tax=Lepeophtheirus salmonis TaxID=72036 RepID=A0A0K2T475_LEPSM